MLETANISQIKDNIIKNLHLNYEDLDFQDDQYPHALMTEYESDDFIVNITYEKNYSDAKQQNAFKNNYVRLDITSKHLRKYPSISYHHQTSPYKDDSFIIIDNSTKLVSPVHAGNYKEIFKAYDEIFSITYAIRDALMPKYFPIDAKYY